MPLSVGDKIGHCQILAPLGAGGMGQSYRAKERSPWGVSEMYSNRLFPAYQMSPNLPTMMSWDDYEAKATAEWRALLNSAEGCDERTIHNFLVRNPSWLPGARSMTRASDYAPCRWALLSESPLREWVADSYRDAVGTKIPDFIWLAHDSNNFTPMLIEIESPC